ncbi:HDIG domain-containing protein [Methanogenium marinum]|uniref:HDIG domain-containing protein n=1 Tax=Methanogenium marinum TaxID=348610 RepID=A0A9Q4PY91_9EURY|nr:HDIG domain-containing metalloprotein [Methanogenium marinum]MDE4907452.1 HDIG domain-containing protein [Methanogenium marinum]
MIAHSHVVHDLACQYAALRPVDRELVSWGAALHDIGRSQTHSLAHAQIGADICREYGLPEEVARIVECHIGAGLTAEECRAEGLKPIDCVPHTPEEKIVAHVDNLVRGTTIISIEERLETATATLPDIIVRRIAALAADVESL